MLLPGVPERPSAAEIKSLVKSRLSGLEVRQQERARVRAARRDARIRPREGQSEQQSLFSESPVERR